MTPSRPAARWLRWRWRALLVATIVIWLPAILLTIALLVSSIADCPVDEGSVHPCVLFELDFGSLLYSFAVSGWLMLVTLPFMALTVVIWLARALVLVTLRVRSFAKRGR